MFDNEVPSGLSKNHGKSMIDHNFSKSMETAIKDNRVM
jgi:hypothetical protein